jgi:tetratricopeptide (TPR) repeat protein
MTGTTEGRALYTPQRLFGEVGSSPEILSHEPFLERARLQREQEHDSSARLAMGAYLVARLVDKLLTLHADHEAAEGFSWQLEAVRRHVGELPADAPETAHLSGVVTAIPTGGHSAPSLWKNLTAYACFLEHEGRLAESLEMLSLAARSQAGATAPKDFTAYALFAGRLNRLLACWDDVMSCYAAAEEAAAETGDCVSVLRGRLGKGAVQRGTGNLPAARLAAEDVVRVAGEHGLPEAQALGYADLGVVYSLQGLRLEALQAHYRAFQLHPDPMQRMRTLGDLGIGLAEIGAYDAARLAFRIVAESSDSVLIRANAVLEMMDLESLVGNRVAFERCRAAVEDFRSRMSPSMSVDYCYKLGSGLARFGQHARAQTAMREALNLAEVHHLNAWYFKVEKALADLAVQREEHHAPAPSELSDAPAVREMEIGLREYAQL